MARKISAVAALLLGGVCWAAAGALGALDENNLLMDVAKKPVPAFNFQSTLVGGQKVQLSDYKGNIVFLNFWATWCIPCVEEMPAMERLAAKLKGKPFRVVAVNMMEKNSTVAKFVKKLKLTYDIVMDESGDIGGNYAANSLPLTYIIDKQGNIIRRAVGARIWDKKESVAFFEKLAAQ